jgi:hypothetical protein
MFNVSTLVSRAPTKLAVSLCSRAIQVLFYHMPSSQVGFRSYVLRAPYSGNARLVAIRLFWRCLLNASYEALIPKRFEVIRVGAVDYPEPRTSPKVDPQGAFEPAYKLMGCCNSQHGENCLVPLAVDVAL